MSTERNKPGLIKGMRQEFKKITWPSKNEVIRSTTVVLGALVAISIIIKLLDLLFRFLLSFTV